MNELIEAILQAKVERIYVVGSSWSWMGPISRELALKGIPLLTRLNSFEATVGEVTVSVYFMQRSDVRKLNKSGAFLKFDTGEWEL